jgi:predicted nucleotidyltransferase
MKIIKDIINTLKTFKEVEAIAFGGSYARGIQDKHSDVDIYVFYTGKTTDIKTRKKVFLPLSNFERTFIADTVDFFILKEKLIHTWWVDINQLRKDIKSGDVYSKVMITESKLLWDRKGKIPKLRKLVKFSLRLSKFICTEDRTLSSVPIIFREVVVKSLYRNRLYFIESFIKNQTENMIMAIYALNRKYYHYGYPQHLEHDFR